MRWNKMAVLLLGAGFTLAAGYAAAANLIYRWVDENGIVHFGSQPPTGVQAAVVDSSPGSASRAAEPAPAGPDGETAGEESELSYAERQRRAREERRREFSEKQRKLEGECEIMRRQRDWVEPSPRVLVQGDDGNPRRLDDAEREELLNEAIEFLEKNCQ